MFRVSLRDVGEVETCGVALGGCIESFGDRPAPVAACPQEWGRRCILELLAELLIFQKGLDDHLVHMLHELFILLLLSVTIELAQGVQPLGMCKVPFLSGNVVSTIVASFVPGCRYALAYVHLFQLRRAL